MPGLLLLVVESEPEKPVEEAERVTRARDILQAAIAKGKAPAARAGFQGMKVDKYFGTDLPPVCSQLGCYVTDDGKRFYCINPACQ
ncbi:MAG TPA: hypothetical protein VI796_06170, partial [Candidatus Thermoplasmatota archaeon]|nr:hypothetical protein [Candidatus Thermoplasmatota archaeon]